MRQALDVSTAEVEKLVVPDSYSYSFEDFLGIEPYEKLYSYISMPFVMNQELVKMDANAKKVKYPGFKKQWNTYLAMRNEERTQRLLICPNQTEFDEQVAELNCGTWEATDFGITRIDGSGVRECACSHPIMPIERLVNIDTGEVKLRLAYKRPGQDKKWQKIIVEKKVVSDPKLLNQSLSSVGVSINQRTAPILMDFLTEIEDRNYDVIPESKSIGRLGYIEGEGFSPYVEGLVFDGDASYRNLYGYIHESGYFMGWLKIAQECRKMSVAARIFLAASFASPLLSVVGSLPFFVHCWGGTGTGKTVALMLAASVWGDPLKGRFVQTFNATRVGQELTAAFLNHLPMCIDELQLTKTGKGQSNFDVYQLAEGVGRARGKKTGGVELTPTWDCCFLTTGEDPIIASPSGGGAVNRVVEIECTPDQKVIVDAPRIAAELKRNFGHAGKMWVSLVYRNEEHIELVRKLYQSYVDDLNKNDVTEKQSLAAAAILTADFLATEWIFKDEMHLRVSDMSAFLASKSAVSVGARAYSWICDWISENENHFYTGVDAPTNSIYGKLEYDMAYINNSVLSRALDENGYNATATYSYLKEKGLIVTGKSRGYGMTKRIGGTVTRCIFLKLPVESAPDGVSDEELL